MFNIKDHMFNIIIILIIIIQQGGFKINVLLCKRNAPTKCPDHPSRTVFDVH